VSNTQTCCFSYNRFVYFIPKIFWPHKGFVIKPAGRNLLNKLFIAPTSKDTDGQQFWLFATNPSTNSTSVATALGSVSSPLYN
jgi:hypothetical protein